MGLPAPVAPKGLNTGDGSNRFKYQPFRARIEKLDVHVARRIERYLDEPEDTGSYFAEALQSWRDLNCTADFTQFYHKINNVTKSLAQIIYHKDTIIDVLEEFLTKKGSLTIEPILNLIVTLARDLQEDFYSYYPRVMGWIIPLVKSQDVETVEWSYNAMAYLFKYLSKPILADMGTTFKLMAPLLGYERQKNHIRRFAAESLSYLIRKLRGNDLKSLIELVIHSLIETSQSSIDGFREGLSLLFFECMKSVDHQFHSKSPAIFKALLEEAQKHEISQLDIENEPVFRLVTSVWKLCLHYSKKYTSEPLWETLISEFNRTVKKDDKLDGHLKVNGLALLTSIAAIGATLRKGTRVHNPSQVYDLAEKCFISYNTPEKAQDQETAEKVFISERTKLVVSLLLFGSLENVLSSGKVLLNHVFETRNPAIILPLSTSLIKLRWSHTNQILLPYMVKFVAACWKSSSVEILLAFTHLIRFSELSFSSGAMSTVLSPGGQLLLTSVTKKSKKGSKSESHDVPQAIIKLLDSEVDWREYMSSALKAPNTENIISHDQSFSPDWDNEEGSDEERDKDSREVSQLALYSALISTIQIISIEPQAANDALLRLAHSLVASLQDSQPEDDLAMSSRDPSNPDVFWGQGSIQLPVVGLLGQALKALAKSSSCLPPPSVVPDMLSLWNVLMNEILPIYRNSVILIDGVASIGSQLRMFKEGAQSQTLSVELQGSIAEALSTEKLEQSLPIFEANLANFQHQVRLSTLRLMENFEQITFKPSDSSSNNELLSPVSLLRSMEEIPVTIDRYREKTNIMRQFSVVVLNGRIPAVYLRCVATTIASNLAVNMKLVWTEVITSLGSFASKHQKIFWEVIWGILDRFGDEIKLSETNLTPEANQQYSIMQRYFEDPFTAKRVSPLEGHPLECPTVNQVFSVYSQSKNMFSPETLNGQLEWHYILTTVSQNERVDYPNLYVLLLKTLSQVGPRIAEEHSDPLNDLFIDFVTSKINLDEDGKFNESGEEGTKKSTNKRGALIPRQFDLPDRRSTENRLSAFLVLYSKFKKPGQAKLGTQMYNIYLQLLMKGESKTQRQALDCILTWGNPSITPYSENLYHLLDEVKFRDELHTFSLDPESEAIHSEHRKELLPVLLRILYGRIILRKGKASSKAGMGARRVAVLSAITMLQSQELEQFAQLIMKPFVPILKMATNESILKSDPGHIFSLTEQSWISGSDDSEDAMDIEKNYTDAFVNIPAKKQLGFLRLLGDMIKQMGVRLVPVLHNSLAVVLGLIANSQRQLENKPSVAENAEKGNEDESDADADADADDEGDEEMLNKDSQTVNTNQHYQALRTIRQTAIRRLRDIFALHPPNHTFEPYIQCIYYNVISPRIDMLDIENTQGPSALLELLHSWSTHPEYLPFLVNFNALTIPMLIRLLSAPKVRLNVISLILDIIESLIKVDEYAPDDIKDLARATVKANTSELLSHINACFTKASKSTSATSKSSASFIQNRVFARGLELLSCVAEYADSADNARVLLELLMPLLRRPNRVVSEKIKAHILEVFLQFCELVLDSTSDGRQSGVTESPKARLFNQYLGAVSLVFSNLKSRACRQKLCYVLSKLAEIDPTQKQKAKKPVSLAPVASLITDLNSYSTKRLDEFDFDTRLAAFAKLSGQMWNDSGVLDGRAWLPLLHNLVYFAQDTEEMSIRSNASMGINKFIDRAAPLLSAQDGSESSTHDIKSEAAIFTSHMVHVVYVAIKRSFALSSAVVRTEFLSVLSHSVSTCGDSLIQFADLKILDHSDKEASFFYNIQHIQVHRRIRALKRFVSLLSPNQKDDSAAMDVEEDNGVSGQEAVITQNQCPFRTQTLTKLLIPLFEHFVFESDLQADHSLVAEAVNTIGAVGMVLPWETYYSHIRKYMRLVQRKPELEKPLVRIVVAFVNNFHFDLKSVNVEDDTVNADATAVSTEQKEDVQGAGVADDIVDSFEVADDDDDDDDTAVEEDIAEALQQKQSQKLRHIHDVVVRSLIPELKKYISVEVEEKLLSRIPIILACIRLLKMLPNATLRLQLPGLLTTLCSLLRSRMLSTREAARETLLKVITLLGCDFVGFIVKEMRSVLKRGYQRHILGYTLHSILNHIKDKIDVGSLDYTLDLMLDIVCEDIFGETAAEKETKELTGKIKEAQTNRGKETYVILARIVDLENLGRLLSPLRDILRETDSPKVTKKVHVVLQSISHGANANPGFDPKVVLTFCHGLIYQNLNLSQKAKDKAARAKELKEAKARMRVDAEDTFKVAANPLANAAKRDNLANNAHRFVEFGLNLVLAALKKRKFDTNDSDQLSMLNPFVDVVGNCLFSRYDLIVSTSLQILSVLTKMPLPAFKRGTSVIIKRIFQLLGSAPNTQSQTVQGCFRFLTSVLRSKTCQEYVDIPPQQLTFLLQFIQPDLEIPDRQSTTFSLIRAIMLKRLVVDTIYDLIDSIRELMVTAQASHTRELCRQAWMQFMMEYPLGEKRIKSSIAFLTQNCTGYAFESGRESAMEAMSDITQKFSDQLFLPNIAEPFFFSLVIVLSSDDSNRCRKVAASMIKLLFARLDTQRLNTIYAALKKWCGVIADMAQKRITDVSNQQKAKQVQLALAALQVYGLLCESLGERIKRRLPEIMEAVSSALAVSLISWKEAEKAMQAQSARPLPLLDELDSAGFDPTGVQSEMLNWEMGYFALNTFNKIVQANSSTLFGQPQSTIWWLTVQLLSHPHAWIRLSSSRLLGQYFAGADSSWVAVASGTPIQTGLDYDDDGMEIAPKYKGGPKNALMTFVALRETASKLIVQINGKILTEEMASQAVKNLLFIGKCFNEVSSHAVDDKDLSNGAGDDDDNDDENKADGNDENHEEEESKSKNKINPDNSLSWLVRKMSHISKLELAQHRNQVVKRTACFRWFAAISSVMEVENLKAYLPTIIESIYRTVEDEQAYSGSAKTNNDELRELGREVMELLQNKVGTSEYFVIYNGIRASIENVRQERREKRKQLAILDPELHASRKLKRNKAKAESKKRKSEATSFVRNKIRVKAAKNRDGL
ncbi:U3 snoRNP protein [Mycoemilia scoparia]|uniref:U3 snoRNP protein n=1 Tax=Mycoemilia scoparia TaxID=417184 RepID=A0A9W8DS52_9FUNG|nr:U3 snoRNP protein [Mycoemilia scoparia]